ncbi:hypothetical protein [Candidatus Pantoea soli]|nr:hypothetical protein [Pantoea soli]
MACAKKRSFTLPNVILLTANREMRGFSGGFTCGKRDRRKISASLTRGNVKKYVYSLLTRFNTATMFKKSPVVTGEALPVLDSPHA